ncbi:cytochrome P450 [Lactifluus subvellereus]|nr:cytochrome P450 [Lactifluus subvellereus]
MLGLLFKFALYAFSAFAGAAFLVVLRHRFRQQHLWKIPGPSTPLLSGVKFVHYGQCGLYTDGTEGHFYRMFNPYAFPFHERLRQNYGRVLVSMDFWGLIIDTNRASRTYNLWYLTQGPVITSSLKIKPSSKRLVPSLSAFAFPDAQAFGPTLFATLGDHHRRQRKLLNPVFNVSHMRYMIPIFHAVARQLREKFDSVLSSGPQEINIVDWMGKVALELIGQAGFGYSFGTLEGRNDQFCNAIKEYIASQCDASEEDRLSEEEVLAQITSFLLTLTPRIAQRGAERACEDNEELTYDRLVSLPYLEAVCRETLRLYVTSLGPPDEFSKVGQLSSGDRSNENVFIPDNTDVFLHIYHLNRDPSIWGDDATEWKPERWLSPLPESVAEANIQGVYANTMTFSGGSRSCIADVGTYSGFKFSQLEMKVVLSHIIPTFRFAPSKAEIVWRLGTISSPSVKGSAEFSPKLPMIVSRI